MIKHYFKIAFRNLWKYKQQNTISVLGLAVGIICFSLSMTWLRYEDSYDSFHSKSDRIYAIMKGDKKDVFNLWPTINPYLTKNLKAQFPEIEEACTVSQRWTPIELSEKVKELNILTVDSSFCRIFDLSVPDIQFPYHINHGHVFTNRVAPQQNVPAAITRETAEKLFGKDGALGKDLHISDDWNTYTIQKEIDSWPSTSIFHFDLIVPLDAYEIGSSCKGYLLLKEGVDVEAFEEKLKSYKDNSDELCIIPIKSYRHTLPDQGVVLQYKYIKMFAVVGLLVACCALLNYLILFISRIKMKEREFALRKVNGASNISLLKLLYTEFIITLFCSLVLSFIFTWLSMPQLKEFSHITLENADIYTQIFTFSLIVFLSIILISIVPIYYFQQQSLYAMIQQNKKRSENGFFYKACVCLQLIICLGFLFCGVILIKQIHYLKTKDIGFDRSRIAWVNPQIHQIKVSYADKIEKLTTVESVYRYDFFMFLHSESYDVVDITEWDGHRADAPVQLTRMAFSPGYADFMGIKIVEGTGFTKDVIDKTEFLVTESAIKTFGWDDPVGKTFVLPNLKRDGSIRAKVVGVIKDIYFGKPEEKTHPVIIEQSDYELYSFAYKYVEGRKEDSEAAITKLLEKDFPGEDIRFTYMDDIYNEYLETEEILNKGIIFVTTVIVIISIFGVYSMVSLTCTRRRKEIAIR